MRNTVCTLLRVVVLYTLLNIRVQCTFLRVRDRHERVSYTLLRVQVCVYIKTNQNQYLYYNHCGTVTTYLSYCNFRKLNIPPKDIGIGMCVFQHLLGQEHVLISVWMIKSTNEKRGEWMRGSRTRLARCYFTVDCKAMSMRRAVSRNHEVSDYP